LAFEIRIWRRNQISGQKAQRVSAMSEHEKQNCEMKFVEKLKKRKRAENEFKTFLSKQCSKNSGKHYSVR
jgi:hypothetical protein